jgi:hypothetical protein
VLEAGGSEASSSGKSAWTSTACFTSKCEEDKRMHGKDERIAIKQFDETAHFAHAPVRIVAVG